jgi:queuine tRNA-ribosyltransferase/7-cyano-7-deazaguanine tRNA-ribosyltransferase
MFKFTIQQKDPHSKARAGELLTPHGVIKTPNFNPVGTMATVKTLSAQDLEEIGAQIVLANTYHLHLRPGEEVVEKMGGLAKFMGWGGPSFAEATAGKPTMTDSGGYQVFSLGSAQQTTDKDGKKLSKFSQGNGVEIVPEMEEYRLAQRKSQPIKPAKMDEEGVTFYSHLDGSEHRLSPGIATRMQEQIGADLIVAFDDHESPLWEYEQTKESLERTNRWGRESLQAQKRKDQLMYGVVHGGLFEDLRKESAQFTDKHFGAISIGGSYTTKAILYQVLDWTIPYFQEDKPRHLLGIGEVQDMFNAIERGMDFFDCVAPTRRGRHGSLYISPKSGGNAKQSFTFQIMNAEFILDQRPIDPECRCKVCQTYSRGYINHLMRADEILGQRLCSYHNVYFIVNLVKQMRQAILEGRFLQMKEEWLG